MISVLFVDKEGIYSKVPGLDLWDKERDARKYIGFNPVVAHPPCQRWGKLARVNFKRWGGKHNVPWNDGGCFFSALAAVRINYGVLEHPAQSYAWDFFGLQKPVKGMWRSAGDSWGWVCEVWQSAYGHRANKATWLYYCGRQEPFELNWSLVKGTHQIGFQDRRGKLRNKPTLSQKEANATPEKFRDELLRLARHSTKKD